MERTLGRLFRRLLREPGVNRREAVADVRAGVERG